MRVKWIPFWNIADFPWRRFKFGIIRLTQFRCWQSWEVQTYFQPIFNRCLGQPPTIAFIQTYSKSFFRVYWQSRPEACFLSWNARVATPSISLSFIARHAVMIRDTCPCCFINERCGQHGECYMALLTARKVTQFAHSSLSSSERIWTEYLPVVREVSRCPCHVLCAYCIAISPAGYLSLRRCQCLVRDSPSSAVLGRKLIRR
jgi:hypothetical protein